MSTPAPSEPLAPRRVPANRRIWIVLAVVVGGLVVANLVAQGLDRAVGGGQPGGAVGLVLRHRAGRSRRVRVASVALRPRGRAATRTGRRRPARRPDTTAFVLEPSVLTANDAEALLQFVTAGGRLVIGGESPFYLHDLADAPPEWQGNGSDLVDRGRPGRSATCTTSRPRRSARGRRPDAAHRSSAPHDASLLTARSRSGEGEIYYLADASPLENAFLGSGDNAAFALALAGDAGRPVAFPEGAHGYGASRGTRRTPATAGRSRSC